MATRRRTDGSGTVAGGGPQYGLSSQRTGEPGLPVPIDDGGNASIWGQTSNPPKIEFDPRIQLGRSGLRQYGGFVYEEFLTILRNPRGAQAWREIIDNSALVGGITRLIDLSMRQISTRVEPFDDTSEDKKRAERFEQGLDDMSHSWPATMSEIVTMLWYGFSCMEIVWKKCLGWSDDPTTRSRYKDGLIMPRKLMLLGQDTLFRWEFDSEGGIRAMLQLPPPDYLLRTIPIEKMLIFNPTIEKGNPEGRSILRSGYFNWQMIKHLTEFEAISAERDATGIPVAYIPATCMGPNATAAQKAVFTKMQKLVQNLRVDDQMGVVMPQAFDPLTKQPMFKLELLSTQGRGSHFDYDKPITRHEVRLAMSVLADVMMLGHDKVGSYALSSDKTSLLAAGIGAWYDSICGVINRYLVPRVWAANGWPLDRPCKFTHGEVQRQNLVELSTVILNLSKAGMELFPDETLENHIREDVGLPEKPQELIDREQEHADVEHEMQIATMGQRTENAKNPPPPPPPGPQQGQFGRQQPPQNQPPQKPGQKPPVKKYVGQARARRGTYQPRSSDVFNALNMLRDRQRIGAGDAVAHGFPTSDTPPFDQGADLSPQVESARVERVPIKGLIATQHAVRRDGVRNFLENPGIVRTGQRSLSGQLEDLPVVVRAGGSNYIADGHHRLAARMLLGHETAMARVIDTDIEDSPVPENQGQPTMLKTPPWKVVERGGKYVVVGQENGKVFGTHDTREEALAQMRALYVNVPDARRKGSELPNE